MYPDIDFCVGCEQSKHAREKKSELEKLFFCKASVFFKLLRKTMFQVPKLRVSPSTAEDLQLDLPLRLNPSTAEDDHDLLVDLEVAVREVCHHQSPGTCSTPPSGICIVDALGLGQLSFFQANSLTACRPLGVSPSGEVLIWPELECNVHSHVEPASGRARSGSSKLQEPPESKV